MINKIEFKKLIGSKLPIWKNEREFRILELESAHAKKYAEESLTGVYLGSEMQWNRKEDLFNIIKRIYPKTRIYGMSFDTGLQGFFFGELIKKEGFFGFKHTNFSKV